MFFNRKKFFDSYRQQFGELDQLQVNGLNRLLWGFETYYGWWNDLRQIANALAQIKHETAHSFNPVVEGYYLGDPNKPGFFVGNTKRVKDFQENLKYYPHFGMGDIQLTWEDNYEKMDSLVRRYFPELVEDFEQRTGTDFNLINHPEQVLDGKISFAIFTVGMHRGTFTGRSLDQFINSREVDHFNARSIVNGDKNKKNRQGIKIGDVIERDAEKFEKVLRAALTDNLDVEIDSAFENLKKKSESNSETHETNTTTFPASKAPQTEAAKRGLEPISPGSEQHTANADGAAADGGWLRRGRQPPEKVAVEKREKVHFLSKIWKKITAVFAGQSVVDMATEKAAQANALGFSQDFWKRLFYLALAAGVVYLISEYYKHWLYEHEQNKITELLVEANTTPTNKVTLAATEDLDRLKAAGYSIVRRGE